METGYVYIKKLPFLIVILVIPVISILGSLLGFRFFGTSILNWLTLLAVSIIAFIAEKSLKLIVIPFTLQFISRLPETFQVIFLGIYPNNILVYLKIIVPLLVAICIFLLSFNKDVNKQKKYWLMAICLQIITIGILSVTATNIFYPIDAIFSGLPLLLLLFSIKCKNICPACNHAINEDSLFCNNCGIELKPRSSPHL